MCADIIVSDDLISEIMKYWGGHRLGLTCRHLFARMNIDDYLRVDIVRRDDSIATLSQLPNGIFHGWSTIDHRIVRYNMMYNASTLLYKDTECAIIVDGQSKIGISRHAVVNGYRVYAKAADNSENIIVRDYDSGRALGTTTLETFLADTKRYVGEMPPGKTDLLIIYDDWLGIVLPGCHQKSTKKTHSTSYSNQ